MCEGSEMGFLLPRHLKAVYCFVFNPFSISQNLRQNKKPNWERSRCLEKSLREMPLGLFTPTIRVSEFKFWFHFQFRFLIIYAWGGSG